MTPEVIGFVRTLELNGHTLDIGSFDVNGNVRQWCKEYTGLDMRSGPNVDIVANSHSIPFPDEKFDNVVWLETIEHDSAFWLTLAESKRVLKPGGKLVITAPKTTVAHHSYPDDYWRFYKSAVELFYDGFQSVKIDESNEAILAWGIK